MSATDQLVIMPRPRSNWQAIDVGFRVARAHFMPLFVLWMGLSIPFFLISEAINFAGGKYGLILWWWFKPFYELPILFFLSKVVFSDTVTIKQCWKLSLRNFGKSMMSYTGLSRLSQSRSTTAPVVFLENQRGAKRRGRAEILTSDNNRAFVMMMGCLHVEWILGYFLLGLIALVFPTLFADFLPEFMAGEMPPSIQSMLNAAVMIAAGFVAPFYVSAGFLIYINRRMRLEAWDIEHQFKSMGAQQKNNRSLGVGKVAVVFLATLLMWQLPTDNAVAADNIQSLNTTPKAAKQSIERILEHSDFGGTDTKKVPKFLKDRENKKDLNLDSISDFVRALAAGVETLLWILAILAVVLIIQFILKFKPELDLNRKRARKQTDLKSAEHHPLTQTLPTDITSQAQQLLDRDDHRGALSLLFRGALRALMQQHNVDISAGATEADCVASLQRHADSEQMSAFSLLVSHWQQEAYAHIPHSKDEVLSLISDWNKSFRPSAERRA